MRDKRSDTPIGLYAAVTVSLIAVFWADVSTPLGFAVWVFYIVPVILTVFLARPSAPVIAGVVVSAALIVGYYVSSPGVQPLTAQMNRVIAIITVFVVAFIVLQTIRSRLAVERQDWLQTGHARLTGKLSGEQREEELAESILGFIGAYVESMGGAIFLDFATSWKRAAVYGCDQPDSIPEYIQAGQGLLGQAAQENRIIVVDPVPDGYLTIGSALGSTKPRGLVIAPFAIDGVTKGVVELGFFGAVDDRVTEFLARISDPVAVAIRSAQYRAKVQNLLEETQRQAGELQAQSEELRVSNEEIEEQSRALKDSHTRLEQQQAELEQTNAQLESQAYALETQKNNLLLSQSTLEAQKRELERASGYKSQFLANMSHELRTPLNSSLILAKLLADNRQGNLTAEQVKYARTILSAGSDLLNLINDVLDLSKVEAGRLELRIADVSVKNLLRDLQVTFEPLAKEKQLALCISADSAAPVILRTDGQRLEQVLRNLLSNAVKFTERGEVELTVRVPSADTVAFTVRDTGIGIAEDAQEAVFQPFRQAGQRTGPDHAGTGLGLSISRELARVLGGQILLETELGRGSSFTLVLPVAGPELGRAHAQIAPIDANGHAPIRDLKITEPAETAPLVRIAHGPDTRVLLVIEDDKSFATVIADLAREIGFEVLIAGTGQEGLTLAAQQSPHCIVLDLGLPDVTGLSVLDRLKKSPATRHIPVHVVSGSDYMEIAYPLGAAGYALKPVKREQLVKALSELERQSARRNRRVLLVEDNAIQLESLCRLFEAPEVTTVPVRSAAECLEKLKAETFDCMVLDLNLPDSSGFSLLETLSQEPAYSFPPVIVYTGRDLSGAEDEKLRRYAKSVILKGAKSPERLLDEVSLFLHQVVATMPAEKQAMLQRARSRDASLEGKRVLIVEDDVRNIFALTSVLEAHGVVPSVARNGREALAMLEATRTEARQFPDLVLMDIMMPEMDGLTATREIRKQPAWKKLPIIVLTAKATRNDQAESLQAGASDYIAKPLDVDKLLSLMRVWMPR